MSIALTVNGIIYNYPERGDNGWGVQATNWAQAVTNSMLQKTGGLFLLSAEVDFGASYGLKSLYYKSRTSNVATAGQIRLARADVISFRNEANDGNLDLGVNSSNQLTFNGVALQQSVITVSDTSTIDLILSAGDISASIVSGSIANAQISNSAAIAYSKLNLSNSILNADVNASAAIALSKLATVTASRALVSDGSGVMSASSVTSTELGYVSGVTSAIQTQLDAKVALSGSTMSGLLVLSGDPVTNLGAATKQYVDNAVQGLDAKASVVCATTANITLSGEQTIDGVLTSASRVLVKNQSNSAENGIYVSAAGSWSRSSDANTWDELISAYVFVEGGTTQADTGWTCTIQPGGTLGVTAVTFVQFSSAGAILAGNGLTKTGNTLDVNVDNSTIEISSNNLRIKDLGVTAAKIANTTITNTQISTSAAIALSKLATVTASRALVSDGSGVMSASSVTSTELGYVSGVTSAIQTQLGTKVTNPMTTGGDLIYGGASGIPTRLANGSVGQVLTSAGGTSAPTWVTPAGIFTVTAVSSNITLAAYNTYLVDTSSARNLQLPAPSSGLVFYIKDSTGSANTNNITLIRNGSESIEGVAANKVLQTNWGSWMIVSDETNWFIL